ncbi:MAG: hypothetical protein ACYC7E_03105 [Armatimonadota bacterium]
MRNALFLAVLAMLAMGIIGCGGGDGQGLHWLVTQDGDILEIAYGSGTNYPQYAALHLDSSYFRLNTGPGSGWGTSVVVMPSFWTGGVYYQGTPITAQYATDGTNLIISIDGTLAGLHSEGDIRLSPPAGNAIAAQVSMTTSGVVTLDNRPGEAFKPVMLSSMHISASQWDAQSAFIGAQSYAIPASGWLVDPPVAGTTFGLEGGTSTWKTNAPTVEITFPTSRTITGWVTSSADPNDDNIGFWAASDQVLTSWQYDIVARQPD